MNKSRARRYSAMAVIGNLRWDVHYVEDIVRASKRNTIKGIKCTVRKKRISDMRLGTWPCLMTPHPNPRYLCDFIHVTKAML